MKILILLHERCAENKKKRFLNFVVYKTSIELDRDSNNKDKESIFENDYIKFERIYDSLYKHFTF